jgi:hypothetical protein
MPKLVLPSWTNATSTTASTLVWSSWNQNMTSTTATITATVPIWRSWNESDLRGVLRDRDLDNVARIQESLRMSAAEREAHAAKLRAERATAERRAELLLQAHLNAVQRAQLATNDWFLIDGPSGTRYRINRGRSANIDVVDAQGRVIRSLCVHPRENVPDADTMLAQALMLRYEEAEVLRLANRHPANHGFRARRLQPTEIADYQIDPGLHQAA